MSRFFILFLLLAPLVGIAGNHPAKHTNSKPSVAPAAALVPPDLATQVEVCGTIPLALAPELEAPEASAPAPRLPEAWAAESRARSLKRTSRNQWRPFANWRLPSLQLAGSNRMAAKQTTEPSQSFQQNAIGLLLAIIIGLLVIILLGLLGVGLVELLVVILLVLLIILLIGLLPGL